MKNVLEFLETTAERYPHKVAVDDGNVLLTWSELQELSGRMGTGFCKLTKQGKPVALLMEKSALTLAAMMGVVYSGCFYVMIDPAQPPSRVKEILAILEPDVVVTDGSKTDVLRQAGYRGRVIAARKLIGEEVDKLRLARIRKQSKETDILYGIFTSGSTGTPKGIVVSHQAVIHFIGHFTETFQITKDERIGNQAPFDFDVSVKDIYSCMKTGATLVLIAKPLFSLPAKLIDFLCEKEVTTLIWAVSALCMISSLRGLEYKVPAGVRRIMFSGEVMPAKQLALWQKALPDAEFVNLYGPSEITCNCTYYRIPGRMQEGEKLPIGHAFEGRDVFLLDEEGREVVKPETAGEICVAGESLADGYYRNETETKKRFVEMERWGVSGVRCYRTGDLGYYDEEMQLYFAGRKDFQIKHMGHRIELEEIERRMETIEGLERCCCMLDEKKGQIAAFYLGELQPSDIRRQMKEILPVYMLPARLIHKTLLPITKNGKIDRKDLKNQLEVG